LVTLALSSTADARLRDRNNGAGVFKYWSPGAIMGLMGQNSGPPMVWRGDWVPRQELRR